MHLKGREKATNLTSHRGLFDGREGRIRGKGIRIRGKGEQTSLKWGWGFSSKKEVSYQYFGDKIFVEKLPLELGEENWVP